MGVKDFMPFVRDKSRATNTSLSQLLVESPLKTWIGIDMSIIIMSAIKGSPKIIDQMFSLPECPIDELNDKVCSVLETFVKEGYFILCCFDGFPGPLKQNGAHLHRYGDHNAKRQRLDELYKMEMFSSMDEEEAVITEAKKLRKELASFNRPDLLYELKMAIKRHFGANSISVGSFSEADHQLGSLFHQGIIDYVYSNDSDLILLGVDLITNVTTSGTCWFMSFEGLKQRMLTSVRCNKTIIWSDELLHFVACFLGNDFLPRNPGNTPGRLSHFVQYITDDDGRIKHTGNDAFWEYIRYTVLEPIHCSAEIKQYWNTDNKRLGHIKKWMEALAMFSDGPAFFIEVDDTNSSIRDAFKNGEFKTYIGSVKGLKHDHEEYWKMDDNKKNTKYDTRTYRLGFHPIDEFKDQLSMREESLETLMEKVIRLEVWSKKGQDIKPLDTLTDNQGRELYHGSILHFHHIPIRFFSRDSLDFWLQARQIQVPSALPDIRSLVNVVWTTLNEKLKPIPKVLMRGRSGYCSPACLVPREGTTVMYPIWG